MLREMQTKLANNVQATLISDNSVNSIDSQISVHLLPGSITSGNVNTEIYCFSQIEEEKSDNEEFETYEENGVYNLNIKHFEDNKDETDDTFTIEKSNCLLDAMCTEENIPEGRCIVDISFVWSEIHRVFDNHMSQGIECQFKDWKLIKSHRCGLLTQFFFKCRMCNHEASIWSERMESKILDINTSVVAGTLKAGISYSQLNNLCAEMNILCMSDETYRKNRENLLEHYNKTVIQNIKQEPF